MEVKECEELVKKLTSDPRMKHLLQSVGVSCRPCKDHGVEKTSRAFLTSKPEVVLCSNKLSTPEVVENALLHEAVHAYDYINKRYDFHTCEGLAATEIRAVREAECGKHKWSWLKNRCIKSSAKSCTNNLYATTGSDCVEKAFELAMKDFEPFNTFNIVDNKV